MTSDEQLAYLKRIKQLKEAGHEPVTKKMRRPDLATIPAWREFEAAFDKSPAEFYMTFLKVMEEKRIDSSSIFQLKILATVLNWKEKTGVKLDREFIIRAVEAILDGDHDKLRKIFPPYC